MVDICSCSPSTTTTILALALAAVSLTLQPVMSPSPLLRDVGSIKTASAPQKRRRRCSHPSPFQRDVGVSPDRQRVWGGRIMEGTQKTTRPEATTLTMGESGGRHDNNEEGRD